MRIKHIIGGLLIAVGMLVAFAALGHLDYLDSARTSYGIKEVNSAALKSGIGLAAAFIGILLCHDIEVEEDKPKEKSRDE